VFIADARCNGAESLVTSALARDSSAADARSDSLPVASITGAAPAVCNAAPIALASRASPAAPITTTRCERSSESDASAAANPSNEGHRLVAHALPGANAIIGSPISTPLAASSASTVAQSSSRGYNVGRTTGASASLTADPNCHSRCAWCNSRRNGTRVVYRTRPGDVAKPTRSRMPASRANAAVRSEPCAMYAVVAPLARSRSATRRTPPTPRSTPRLSNTITSLTAR